MEGARRFAQRVREWFSFGWVVLVAVGAGLIAGLVYFFTGRLEKQHEARERAEKDRKRVRRQVKEGDGPGLYRETLEEARKWRPKK